jgi:hypothetical protein
MPPVWQEWQAVRAASGDVRGKKGLQRTGLAVENANTHPHQHHLHRPLDVWQAREVGHVEYTGDILLRFLLPLGSPLGFRGALRPGPLWLLRLFVSSLLNQLLLIYRVFALIRRVDIRLNLTVILELPRSVILVSHSPFPYASRQSHAA